MNHAVTVSAQHRKICGAFGSLSLLTLLQLREEDSEPFKCTSSSVNVSTSFGCAGERHHPVQDPAANNAATEPLHHSLGFRPQPRHGHPSRIAKRPNCVVKLRWHDCSIVSEVITK